MAYIQLARLVVLLLTVTVSVSVSAAAIGGDAAVEKADVPRATVRVSVQAQEDEEKKTRPGAVKREHKPMREVSPLLWLLERARIAANRLADYVAPVRGTLQTLCVRLND